MSAPQPVRRAASGAELLAAVKGRFGTVLADPPWRFSNRTGKMAPEHRRLSRYRTMTLKEIAALPVARLVAEQSHLYLWVPNALLAQGLEVLESWGFTYKTNIVWFKVRKDGGPDGRGVGFYFRNVTELVLFGVRGDLRTRPAGRRQTNIVVSRKREHSRKPDELYEIIEQCSPGPYLELFARHRRRGWAQRGDEVALETPQRPGRTKHLEDGDAAEPRGAPSVLKAGGPPRLPGLDPR
jgi:N6-adenosine-specific RNA methylase IME4